MAKKLIIAIGIVAVVVGLVLAIGRPGSQTPGRQQVEVIVLIRSDLSPYPEAGHYVAHQLEQLGFKVTRLINSGEEARAFWQDRHPSEGAISVYTGGFSYASVPRDQGDIFDLLYTHRGLPYPLWTALAEPLAEFPEFDDAAMRLRFKDFSTMQERHDLFETALWEAMRFSSSIWTVDIAGANPFRQEIAVAVDAAGGISDPTWAHTVHFHDNGVPRTPDGTTTLRVEMPALLVYPWNPVEGSPYVYDLFVNRRALGDGATLADPREGELGGAYWPHRVESAQVWVDDSLPVVETLPWVTLTPTADPIVAPDSAWADWDAQAQRFITVAEKTDPNSPHFDEGFDPAALRKTRVVYPADIFDVPLHDGSTLSMADFLMSMIVGFERGKEGSPIYDSAQKATLDAWMRSFRGVEIASVNPLTIDTWSDMWFIGADENAQNSTWFPTYGTYEWTGFWHMVTVGWLTEHWPRIEGFPTDVQRMAFSKEKSDDLRVDWLDYTKGDSLAQLKKSLDWAAGQGYIPYEGVIRAFYEEEFTNGGALLDSEIAARWANLEQFYNDRGHFWVGNGPFVIESVRPVAKIVTLERFEDYPDSAGRWLFFVDPDPVGVPPHTGAWVDRVVLTEQRSHAIAMRRMADGEIHMYAFTITDPAVLETIEADPGLDYRFSYGAYRNLIFNTYRNPNTGEPFFSDGRLNPFAIPEIREAMNWAIDRERIRDEYLQGMGLAKWTALSPITPDYARYHRDVAGPIEAYYEFDLVRADAAIEEAMLAIPGVTRDADGRYWYLKPQG